jgi:hypothetical protein
LRSRRDSGLLHPVALAAIAVLLVNDHVLKDAYPGWATGKLSDVAGLVFFPLLLAMILPIRTAIGATGLAFAAVKLWEPANGAGEWVMGAIRWPLDAVTTLSLPALARVDIVRDPTDLLALPSLAAAWWIYSAGGRDSPAGTARARVPGGVHP